MINNGLSPIIESELQQLITGGLRNKLLSATADVKDAIMNTELSFVCVGTPSRPNGSLDYRYILAVCNDIGRALQTKKSYHVVVIRSTVLPGSMIDIVIPAIEKASAKRAGVDFGVCNNPEFLREGTAVHDYDNPPKTVIGEQDTRAGDCLASLYHDINAPLIRTSLQIAEMVKYVDNVWHAVKVSFANEIGSICGPLEIDSHKVMDIFCQDKKLNISEYYLKPGFAFGGSCLPKDVRALRYNATRLDLDLPMLDSILRSNAAHLKRCIELVRRQKGKKIGVLGLSFKAGTDDLRESPMVEMIEFLIGKGYDIRIFDRNVNLAKLIGANKDYILNAIPHLSGLMLSSIEDVLDHAEILLIGNNSDEYASVLSQIGEDQIVLDFVRLLQDIPEVEQYFGVCW